MYEARVWASECSQGADLGPRRGSPRKMISTPEAERSQRQDGQG